MGFFKKIFGGKHSQLNSETIRKTKLFIEPQILSLEKENIKLVLSVRTIAYIVCVAEKLGNKAISSNDFERLLITVSDNKELQEAFKGITLGLTPQMYTDVLLEMKTQANNDIETGTGKFLINHAQDVRKKLDAMMNDENWKPGSSSGKVGDVILGAY